MICRRGDRVHCGTAPGTTTGDHTTRTLGVEEREEEECWVCDSVGVVKEREPCVRQGGLDCVRRDLRGPTKESLAGLG